ncbi:hypothetical protein E4H12_07975 [Candidatus Thorarchaeota archaeon]|nr:MAG: hypothetical protein E4H12_07975 [Candidatus Thorarchaeota archaeon]
MRKIEIQLNKDTYTSGETIEGHILLSCDDDFQCERLSISLLGEEIARVVIHAGKVTIVHEEKREHIDYSIEFGENLTIPMGESRYDFSFTLPSDIPGSYIGSHGSIKFFLQAKAEISWARDLKSNIDLYVPFKQESQLVPISNPKSETIAIDEKSVLKIQLDEDHIPLGTPVSFRFSVDRAAKIRGVRTEIIREEHIEPKGHKMNTKRTFAELYFPNEEIVRDSWIESSIQTNSRWTPTFSSELIVCSYLLKITLDIPRSLDSAIEIPIILVQSEIHEPRFEF